MASNQPQSDLSESTTRRTIVGGFWLLLNTLVINLAGVVFWFLAARISGVESVGFATSIISAAIIAQTLAAAGLNFAVLREVSEKPKEAVGPSLLTGILLGLGAGMLAIVLSSFLGYRGLGVLAVSFFMGLVGVIAMVGQSGVVGLEMFRRTFLAGFASNASRLALLPLFAIFVGTPYWAPLLAMLGGFVTGSAIYVISLVSCAEKPLSGGLARWVRKILVLSFSNYPYVFSLQLMTGLSVYVFNLLTGDQGGTGILYLSIMVLLALSSFPNSLVTASFTVGIRSGTDPMAASLRLGLVMATPIAVMIMAEPSLFFKLVGRAYEGSPWVVEILLLSLAPLSTLAVVILRLNRQYRKKQLAVLGISLLITYLALMVPLTARMGLLGAALSFLASTMIVSLASVTWLSRELLRLLLLTPLHALMLTVAIVLRPLVYEFWQGLGLSFALGLASLGLLYLLRFFTLDEVKRMTGILLRFDTK